MRVYTQSRRPAERTEQFLESYLAQQHHLPGDRLPSPRQIAEELGVSESTVRSVVRRWTNEGRLRSRQGSGIFIAERSSNHGDTVRIGANTRHIDRSSHLTWMWGDTIHMSAVEAVLELGPRGGFTSLYSANERIEDLPDREVVSRLRSINGLILHQNDPHNPAILEYCQKHRIPVVYLNPPRDDAMANFVALEMFTSSYRIAKALCQAGRKRFLFLINPDVDASVTIRQRLSGIINGIGTRIGNGVELRVVHCESFFTEHGYHAVKKLLDEGDYIPDALLTAGDHITLGAIEALREKSIHYPDDISIIAGAGFAEGVFEQQLTTLVHPLRELGRQLVMMLLEMIEQQRMELPARLLPIGLKVGRSTRAEENRLLQCVFDHPLPGWFQRPDGII